MTLRDKFALQALPAAMLVANDKALIATDIPLPDRAAVLAYQVADAMLAARKR